MTTSVAEATVPTTSKTAVLQPKNSPLTRLISGIPTVVTFGLLGSVAWFGHHHGWKLPKASDLRAASVTTKVEDAWCSDHNVPEAICVECKTDLLPFCKVPRWCKQHGVSECPTHHLELAQVSGEARLPKYDTVAAIGLFNRVENNSRCKKFLRRIQFESQAAFDKTGIEVDVVSERPMNEALKLNGELGYDQSQVAHLSTRVPGSVWKVFKRLGEEVQEGDILALVDAAEVGKAKTALGTAVVQLQLRKKTYDSLKAAAGAVPEKQIREAEFAYEEARIQVIMGQQALINLGFEVPVGLEKLDAEQLTRKLQCLGLPNELCETFAKRGHLTMNLLPLVAPQAGTIVEMDVVPGEVVSSERVVITLAKLDRMWLTLHVKQEDAKYVRVGQTATFKADGSAAEASGDVIWVSPAVDEVTRTLSVRVVLPNDDLSLKANAFGTGTIVLRSEPQAITVPKEAVQWDSDCHVVFVRDKDFLKKDGLKVFHTRQVRVGAKSDSHVELLAGALPGEVIATKGSAAFQAELLKSAFGESCCGGHAHGGKEKASSKSGSHAGHEH